MSWVDALGWAGSALLIYSLLQARVLRFRLLNCTASIVLMTFNAILAIWPMVAMNLALCMINLWFIRKLLSERHDPASYVVLEVDPDDAYLRHVLDVHEHDIRKYFPNLRWSEAPEGRSSFLVQRGDETVGVVLVRDAGGGVAQVEVDYVTQRFRDFSPGEFVYRRSGLFREHGFRQVLTPPGMVGAYYDRLGFTKHGSSYLLDVSQPEPA
jgi:hypothetical protein